MKDILWSKAEYEYLVDLVGDKIVDDQVLDELNLKFKNNRTKKSAQYKLKYKGATCLEDYQKYIIKVRKLFSAKEIKDRVFNRFEVTISESYIYKLLYENGKSKKHVTTENQFLSSDVAYIIELPIRTVCKWASRNNIKKINSQFIFNHNELIKIEKYYDIYRGRDVEYIKLKKASELSGYDRCHFSSCFRKHQIPCLRVHECNYITHHHFDIIKKQLEKSSRINWVKVKEEICATL